MTSPEYNDKLAAGTTGKCPHCETEFTRRKYGQVYCIPPHRLAYNVSEAKNALKAWRKKPTRGNR